MAKTSKGHIQQLPSGSFRVKVYAGTDPVTGKARLLRQTWPDEAAAYAALSRMLVEAGGGRFPDHSTFAVLGLAGAFGFGAWPAPRRAGGGGGGRGGCGGGAGGGGAGGGGGGGGWGGGEGGGAGVFFPPG